MRHQEFETLFSEALIAPVSPNPSKRFAVYRNNVFVGLVEALRARYPAIVNAVGLEFFNAIARDYASLHHPQSPQMMFYGESFPDFLASHDALHDYAWLADVARLEKAMTKIYHARDQKSLTAAAFAGLTGEVLVNLKFELIDACAIITSDIPLVTLWQMNIGAIEPAPVDALQPEAALIYREDFDVVVKAIAPEDAAFIMALQAGQNLADAVETLHATDPTFDPRDTLALLIKTGLILSLTPSMSGKSS